MEDSEGEIWAAQVGLDEAHHRGLKQIVVEGNSLLAIEAINHFPKRRKWRSHGRIEDIVNLASVFYFCSFTFCSSWC